MTDKLLPCPFCGGEAEADYQQGYRAMQSGRIDHGAAIYCTNCNANMIMCRGDFPELSDEERMSSMYENWNRRAPAPAPHVEVPEGWQLVPNIPTTEMECAPDHEDCPTPDAARAAYLAILASAPPSPLGIVTVPVIHPIQKEISTAPIPPCPFCDCNDDVISLRDQLRDAQMAIRLARPYVEDRLHRIDGEIDGAVALLLSSLDAASPAPAPQMAGDQHPDSLAVDRFSAAMKAKLAKKREEGRGGWEDKDRCTNAFLSQVTVDGISCLYSEETPQGGVIRIAKWPEGYVLWYHGQIVWRSWAAEGQNDG